MTIREAYTLVTVRLGSVYDAAETDAIGRILLDHLAGKEKKYTAAALDIKQEKALNDYLRELETGRPLQYVLGEAWFCGLRFYVDERVLIPRPETEELVEWIISHVRFPVQQLNILDVGSGSGCIPVALKRRIRKAEVWSCDVSADALVVAEKNATELGTPVHFIKIDFLDPGQRDSMHFFDIIVSNPPYVPLRDKGQMHRNVLDFEPHQALFVPDEDALVFYRALASFGKTHLSPGGALYMEIHESLGQAAEELFREQGYLTTLKTDLQQKDRLLRAGLSDKK